MLEVEASFDDGNDRSDEDDDWNVEGEDGAASFVGELDAKNELRGCCDDWIPHIGSGKLREVTAIFGFCSSVIVVILFSR